MTKQETTKLIAELKAEIIEEKNTRSFKEYMRMTSLFHHYSITNIMLIARQMPTATRVAGYVAWQKLGRQVMEGQKGICIIAPAYKEKTADNEEDIKYFRVVRVFDLSQTEGEPLPDYSIDCSNGNIDKLLIPAVEQLIADERIDLIYNSELDSYGSSHQGAIIIRKGMDVGNTFTTMIHELGHEMLHKSEDRLNLTSEQKEIEAETAAYIVSKHFNIDTEANIKYLSVWQKKDDIFSHLERVRQCSSRIISGIEKSLFQIKEPVNVFK